MCIRDRARVGLPDSSLARKPPQGPKGHPQAASQRRHIVKAQAKKTKTPAKAVPKPAGKPAVKAKLASKAAAKTAVKAVKKTIKPVKPVAKAKSAAQPVSQKKPPLPVSKKTMVKPVST